MINGRMGKIHRSPSLGRSAGPLAWGLPSPGVLQEQGVRPAKALQDKVPQIDLLHGAGVDDTLGSLTCTI